ncbi:MAG: hypothetical protein OES19_02935 [Nitrosopumilus sp.]|nr:hypothetical protein [Nitrosopumilus sp.]
MTQIETKFSHLLEINPKSIRISMKDTCHKCNDRDVETLPTEVLLNDTGIITVPLCEKCRMFWYA